MNKILLRARVRRASGEIEIKNFGQAEYVSDSNRLNDIRARRVQVRQHEVPPGKHALIHVKQPRGQLVAVRARPATQAEPPPRELRLWQDCDVVQVRKATAKIGLAVINSRARDSEKECGGGTRETT